MTFSLSGFYGFENRRSMKARFYLYFVVSSLIILALAGCAEGGPEPSPVSPTVQPPSSPTIVASPSPNPTATSTPLPLGILLAPPDADPGLAAELSAWLLVKGGETGLDFQVRETLSENDFQADDIQWVVALPPVSNLVDLAVSAPETKFLAVGFSDLEAAANLSVILSETTDLDQQGFIAGYIAAMITPDWRVGVISLTNDPVRASARAGFIAGAKYFCGLCRPKSPPYFEYPLFVEYPPGASSAEWQTAADILLDKGVETIYLVPGAGDDALFQYLAQSDVKLIGGESEAPAVIADQWVVSLRFDTMQTVQDYWPDFMAGMDGESIQIPLTLADPNPDLLSLGRQHNAEKILAEILAGYIETQ